MNPRSASFPPELLDLARRAAAAVDGARVVELTRELVRIRSVVEPEHGGTEEPAARFLAATLEAGGFTPVLDEVAPHRPNVICDWHGSAFAAGRDRTLMFEGHTDVVTEGDPTSWQHPPFAAVVDGDRIYGRGSADMKGGVAAAIVATEAVRSVAPELPGRIRLGFVVDEEGMMTGIKQFIANGWADDVAGAIICEPEENELCLVQKGAMRVRVQFRGVMAHGAMPYAGTNPIAALSSFVEAVKRLEADEQQRVGAHPYLGLPWLTPTIVRAPSTGEAQLNVMPADAELALDIRTIPGQDHAKLLEALQRVARELEHSTPNLSITVDCFESRPATQTPKNDPLVSALETACPLTLGRPARYGGVPGATDGTFLRATAGVPIVTVGPGDRTIPHQCDEFVRIDELVAAARLYAAAAVLYLGSRNIEHDDDAMH